MADKASRTEEPTPKKLRDAKKKGQVAKSADLNASASFFLFVLLTGVLSPFILNNGIIFLRNSLSIDYSTNISGENVGAMLLNGILTFGYIILPFAIIAVIMGIAINLVQVGFLFTVHPLKPDIKKLNPIEGFKNIFSGKSLFTLVKNVLKLTLVFYMTYRNLTDSIVRIINAGDIGTPKLFQFIMDLVKDLSINIAIVMLALAVVDYVFQRRDHKKKLKMSKQDIKDEFKEMEGNPEMKAARQQRQRQIAMGRMMASIPTSTVVITNPTHIAVVLQYNSESDKAPLLTAKGADYIAEKIKDIAKENNIPIMESKALARNMYSKVEVGDYVPVELYKAIAEILAIVYQIKEKNKHKI
ncbi:flagellar biosynthesis protein FlhB [Alkalibaculum sp. M08DMB]|uniref:Flagellar biosynthetic protein FlhB n=1 Tax=Alkalibaculum sporogenes TaxID=2655001 RepID=A0A6A7K5V3_9FIRM|nr:flagellar biosynthesis protein FlhB [Alkalibaculum sporogenes]MPW24808.1 flagellar biosynthesis protein FlhB [Alkalibaculum sporogenes]